MKIRFRILALVLVALFGSLFASSQHTSASQATDRPASGPAAGPNLLGRGSGPPAGSIPAPGIVLTYTTYLPMVMKNYVQGIYGYLNQGGAPIGGISVALWLKNGSSYSTVATTTTNSAGYYLFTGIPALAAGQSYYVLYWNTEANSSRLSSWGSADVTSYSSGSSVYLGISDLANIALVSPSHGTTVTLPRLFQWTARAATTSDSYFWILFDPYGPDEAVIGPLGYVGGYTLISLPGGFSPYVQYGWGVSLIDLNGGIGYSYYYRYVTFTNTGAAVSSPLNMASQLNGRRNDRPLPARSEE